MQSVSLTLEVLSTTAAHNIFFLYIYISKTIRCYYITKTRLFKYIENSTAKKGNFSDNSYGMTCTKNIN